MVVKLSLSDEGTSAASRIIVGAADKMDNSRTYAPGQLGRLFAAVTASAAFMSAIPIATAANPVPLAQMAGQWKGSGWASRATGAARESVRCRLKAKYSAKTRKLSLSGKCASTNGTFTLLGHIADYSNSNKLTGRWVNPRGIGSMNIAGSRKGNRLTFLFDAKDKQTNRKTAYRTIWDLRNNGFSLNTGLSAGPSNALGQIDFKR